MELKTALHISNDGLLKFHYIKPSISDNPPGCYCKIRKIEHLADNYYRVLWQLIASVTPELKETTFFKPTLIVKSGTCHRTKKLWLRYITEECNRIIGTIQSLKEVYRRIHSVEYTVYPEGKRDIYRPQITIKYPEGSERVELDEDGKCNLVEQLNSRMVKFTAFVRNIKYADVTEDMLLFDWTTLEVKTDVEDFKNDVVKAHTLLKELNTFSDDLEKKKGIILEREILEIKC